MSWRTAQSHVGIRWQRNDNPLLQPIHPNKFLHRASRAFSIGSCFADNLNRWLQHQGFSVPNVSWGLHYNTRTILYELRRAAGLPAPSLDWVLNPGDGTQAWVDALRHCIDAGSAEELRGVKAGVDAQVRLAFEQADCFLITLGLSDVWELHHLGETVTLNRAPYSNAHSENHVAAGQATNRFLSVRDCVDDIQQIVNLIRTHKPRTTPIVLSVSPIPLKHTSNQCHPHIANSRSKATLLAAVFEFIEADAGQPKVSYFPSYEFFQGNPLNLDLWQGDGRHPTAQAICSVAEAFVATYAEARIDLKPGFSVPIFS